MSGALKYFLDRVFYPCEGRIDGEPWALFERPGECEELGLTIAAGLEAGVF